MDEPDPGLVCNTYMFEAFSSGALPTILKSGYPFCNILTFRSASSSMRLYYASRILVSVNECRSSGTCRRIIDCSTGAFLRENSTGPGVS